MPAKQHRYQVTVEWTGNQGPGTISYVGYGRDHVIHSGAKPPIAGSSDPAFRGDAGRWNPEEMLLASVSACHKLWYLHLCSTAGIVVISYIDDAEAIMEEDASGAGRIVSAALHPRVVIKPGGDAAEAVRLHHEAHRYCFIANSVKFPIGCEPVITTEAEA